MPSVSFRIAPRFFFVKQNIMLFPTRSVAFAWFFHIFQLAHLHQNDIIPNLAHILKRNDILLLPPKNPAQAPGSRDDQMRDAAVFRIKFHIAHKAQLFTVTDVDDFFFFRSKIRIAHIRNLKFLTVVYAYSFQAVPENCLILLHLLSD